MLADKGNSGQGTVLGSGWRDFDVTFLNVEPCSTHYRKNLRQWRIIM